jgi:hypothetical protein
MSKDSTKNLVGQPIFKQIFKLIPKEKFDELVIKYGSNKYYKSFFNWEWLVTMLFMLTSVAIRWGKSVKECKSCQVN